MIYLDKSITRVSGVIQSFRDPMGLDLTSSPIRLVLLAQDIRLLKYNPNVLSGLFDGKQKTSYALFCLHSRNLLRHSLHRSD